MDLQIGSVFEGKVTGITTFGAFVSLPAGKSGMVHISEVAESYVDDIKKHLTEGQIVKVKVIGIDKAGRINLSIKKAVESPPPKPQPPKQATVKKSDDEMFEDRLKQFMQTSESRISDSKLYSKKNIRRRK